MTYRLVDPDAQLNWSHDWGPYLADGESITSRQWTITPLNGTSAETPTLSGDTSDTVVATGFQAGKIYHLSEIITTDVGNTDERTIVLRCEQR